MPAAPLTALHARTHSSPAPGKYAGGGDSGNGTPTAAAAVVAAVAASVPASSRPSGSGGLQIVGYEESGEEVATTTPEFPQRPGRQLCDFYVKTGNCKFGADCVNDHPLEYAVPLTLLGYPLRPGQPVCAFYLKNANCKYAASCRFHHPALRPIYAGTATAPSTTLPQAGGDGSSDGDVGPLPLPQQQQQQKPPAGPPKRRAAAAAGGA